MKISLNRDYACRHLFVTLLMLALAGWFAFDGFVRYPKTPAAELYRSIEGEAPKAEMTIEQLESFKRQKTHTQYGFTLITVLAGMIVGLRLLKSAKFAFEFDENGFTYEGKTYTKANITEVDRSRWEKKSILTLKLDDGKSITLDAWHHLGVKDFAAKI